MDEEKMDEEKIDEECSICLESRVDLGEYVQGCSHMFCFECISTWVVNSRAYCPLCLQPAFGLRVPEGNNDIYLSPHFGLFGLTFVTDVKKDRLRVVDVTAPNFHRIQVGACYMVNGHQDAEECAMVIKTAHLNKRMIRLSRGEEETERSQLRFGCFGLSCLARVRLLL